MWRRATSPPSYSAKYFFTRYKYVNSRNPHVNIMVIFLFS